MTRIGAAAALAAIVASTLTLGAQTPVFRSRRDIVRLDVLVSDRGRPVPGYLQR